MKKIAKILVFTGMVLMTACHSAYFDKRYTINEAKWDIGDKAVFDVNIDDTASTYLFGLEVRHLENYRYSNLYVFMNTYMPNGNITRDTIECVLAMPDGQWLGKHSGSMCDAKVLLNDKLRFPDAGNYRFTIEHAMRDTTLKGITDIGLIIDKVK